MDEYFPGKDQQDKLDAQYKALLKKHNDELETLRRESLHNPVNLEERQKTLTEKQVKEMNDFLKKEHLYKQTKAVINGEPLDRLPLEIKDHDPDQDYPTRPREPKKEAPDLDNNQEKMLELERQHKLREVQESLQEIFERKHKKGLSMGH